MLSVMVAAVTPATTTHLRAGVETKPRKELGGGSVLAGLYVGPSRGQALYRQTGRQGEGEAVTHTHQEPPLAPSSLFMSSPRGTTRRHRRQQQVDVDYKYK